MVERREGATAPPPRLNHEAHAQAAILELADAVEDLVTAVANGRLPKVDADLLRQGIERARWHVAPESKE